ncbi:hypothetical protein [Longimicrobium sp.]|uniref:hypothetical protein n=1 Tax=Longimicrobium sp. TaxID=2029185 RepID=UPI002E3730B5|nr:hypothetical protein [Longimicrobium sp.]HEX6042131.1 hypothetical protein [Longimicrobium sp.]
MTLLVGLAAASGCQRLIAPGAPQPRADDEVFGAAATHVAADEGWEVRVDPRLMDSVRTAFDPALDSGAAPMPHFARDARVEQARARTLDRAGIPHGHMDAFVACTAYIGGIPTDSAAADPDFSARRRECLDRHARTAVASLGRARMLGDGRWSIRVYVLTPVSRAVYDLLLARADDGWNVDGRQSLLDVTM